MGGTGGTRCRETMRPGATAAAEKLRRAGKWITKQHSSAGRRRWLLQRTLMNMSERPRQFREPALSALLRQAWRARSGRSDGMNYMTVPF
jgi:hypothetical protein